MKNKNNLKYLEAKANNTNSIRVLYKKSGQAPEVRIIDNIFKLKKAIIKRNLDIIPYKNLYIICNNENLRKYMPSNIVLTFKNIKGDLILVDIDKNKREFKSLSQEDIIWYSQDLITKSPNNTSSTSVKKTNTRHFPEFYERNFEDNIHSNNFEQTLINVLVNIELVLASILKNNKIGDWNKPSLRLI